MGRSQSYGTQRTSPLGKSGGRSCSYPLYPPSHLRLLACSSGGSALHRRRAHGPFHNRGADRYVHLTPDNLRAGTANSADFSKVLCSKQHTRVAQQGSIRRDQERDKAFSACVTEILTLDDSSQITPYLRSSNTTSSSTRQGSGAQWSPCRHLLGRKNRIKNVPKKCAQTKRACRFYLQTLDFPGAGNGI